MDDVTGEQRDPNHSHPEVVRRHRRRERARKKYAERGADQSGCVWPKCPKQPGRSWPNLPLCDAHVQIVHEQVMRARQVTYAEIDERIRLDREQQRNAQRQAGGWIYYIRVGDHIKIGYASRLKARLNAYPPTSKLLAAHHGTTEDEAALHRRLSAHTVAGREWYGMTEPILQHIAAVVAEYGQPTDDPFEARRNRSAKPTKAGSLSGSGPQMRRRSKGSGIRAA